MDDDRPEEPIALAAYDALAESYAALIDTKPHNAYYERPATLSLLPGGHLVFSTGHPTADFFVHHDAGNYFETELVDYEWTGFGTPVRVPFYRRPLGEVINPLLEAGFALERLLEPTPTAEFRDRLPEDYTELSRRPGFLCVRAVKRQEGG